MAIMNIAYKVVKDFEETVAAFAGSKYGVAVESGSAAIFLCCEYLKVKEVIIPKFTYPSVPNAIIHAGGKVKWSDEPWTGVYELQPYKIIDGALRFKRGMYQGGYHCLSFHIKKNLPIGRGGMILTDDEKAYRWFRRARFDGREEAPLSEGVTQLGWNFYMQPEQAARGLQIFDLIKNRELADLKVEEQGYPNLSKYKIYQ